MPNVIFKDFILGQKQVNMIVGYKGVQKLRPLLLRFRSKSPSFNVQKIESGKYQGQILIKFYVSKEHYNAIVEKLEEQNIRVIHDEDELRNSIHKHIAANLQEEITTKVKPGKVELPSIDVEKLDALLKHGKTEEALNHSRDIIEQGNELIEGVNSILEKATLQAIDDEKQKCIANAEYKKDCLSNIVSIASDEIIHAMPDSSLSEIAGNEAINICLDDEDFVSELIKISNDVNIHSRINLKAAIRFSEKVFEEEKSYSKELGIAVESLNLLWLNFAHEVFQKDFSELEIGSYHRLVSYVSKKREKTS